MPYSINRQGDNWIVRNKKTGQKKGVHDSYVSALKQMRLLYGIEGGMKVTGKSSTLKKKRYAKK